ncbi:MAG: indole-3-glycerol phosphate synthase TrpC, partial [Thermodesulfobacteriota bacterium]
MILDEIMASKRAELKGTKESVTLAELEAKLDGLEPVRDFVSALKADGVRIIAEVKKASPSKGIIREDFDPVEIALEYEANGAAAISVLTEEKYFEGSLDFLSAIRERVTLPLLRKDFIFDDYQLVEARVFGADAVLLIMAVLDDDTFSALFKRATELGLFILVEVHHEAELERAVRLGAQVIGINNRDLKSFVTDIETTRRLIKLVPEGCTIVSES